MKLLYYVEMRDNQNEDEWSNKVDLYGYEKEVYIMAMNYSKHILTSNFDETVKNIDKLVAKLEKVNFVIINKECKDYILTN